jgi:hypothetical protein
MLGGASGHSKKKSEKGQAAEISGRKLRDFHSLCLFKILISQFFTTLYTLFQPAIIQNNPHLDRAVTARMMAETLRCLTLWHIRQPSCLSPDGEFSAVA